MWLTNDGFVEKFNYWWNSYYFGDTSSFFVAGKLKTLKNNLKIQNIEVFKHTKEQKKFVWGEFNALNGGDTNSESLTIKNIVMDEIVRVLLMVEKAKNQSALVEEGEQMYQILLQNV